MPIRFEHHEGKDVAFFALTAERDLLPRCVNSILNDMAAYAIGAYDGDVLVGAFTYSLSSKKHKFARKLFAEGTVVANARRGESIGSDMWVQAIRKHRTREVEVYIVSHKAVRMLRQVEARVPSVRIKATFGESLRRSSTSDDVTSRYAKAWERDHGASVAGLSARR